MSAYAAASAATSTAAPVAAPAAAPAAARPRAIRLVANYAVCTVCGTYGQHRVTQRLSGSCSGRLSMKIPEDRMRAYRRDRILAGKRPRTGEALRDG